MENVAAALLLGLIAAQTSGSGSVPYFSETVVGVSVVGSLLVLWRFQRSIIGPLTRRAEQTERRAKESEWRLNALLRWLRETGVAIPDQILYGRPPWERNDRSDAPDVRRR